MVVMILRVFMMLLSLQIRGEGTPKSSAKIRVMAGNNIGIEGEVRMLVNLRMTLLFAWCSLMIVAALFSSFNVDISPKFITLLFVFILLVTLFLHIVLAIEVIKKVTSNESLYNNDKGRCICYCLLFPFIGPMIVDSNLESRIYQKSKKRATAYKRKSLFFSELLMKIMIGK